MRDTEASHHPHSRPAAFASPQPDIAAPGQITISARARGIAALPYGTFRCSATPFGVTNAVTPSQASPRTGTGTTLFDVLLTTQEALLLVNVASKCGLTPQYTGL